MPHPHEPAPAGRRGRPPVWLLVALTGVGPFSMQILIPSLPALGAAFGAGSSSVQLALTLFFAGVAVGQLIYGPLSDHFGRRPVLLAALGLYVVASVGAVMAPTLGWLVAARILQAIGACSGMVLGRAMIRDTHDRDQAASVMGYVTMGMTVAPMVAPMIGAMLEQYFGWRAAIAACLGLGVPLLLVVWRVLPETLPAAQPLPGAVGLLRMYGALLVVPAFRAYGAVTAFSAGVFFAFLSGAPYVVVNGLGLPSTAYATAFVSISVTYALGNLVAGRMSTRVGVLPMLRLGTTISSICAVGMLATVFLLPAHIVTFFAPMALVAMGNGIAQPNAIAAAVSVRPQLAGTASGLTGFLQMGLGAALSFLVAVIETGSGIATASVMCICGLLAQISLAFERRVSA